jgi:sugar lactone lactonase YvrE
MKYGRNLPAGIVFALAVGGLLPAAGGESPGLELVATIPEPDLIPEGIAFDPATRTLYVSSIRKRKIVAVSPDGKARDFIGSGQDGIWSVLGMKVDPESRTLLACSEVDGPGMEGFSPGDAGKSAVFEFDLATGKVVHVFRAPAGGPHLFNDLVLTRSGVLYVTDSKEGTVWRIDRRSGRVARFAPAGRFVYPNGIAIDSGERILFVADDRSIHSVELATGTRRELAHSPRTKLGQADGLYFDGGALVAIQNGDPPIRVVRFSLSKGRDRVTGEMVLASADPRLPEPTTGAIVGDRMYLVGDAQLRAIGKDGTLWPRERLSPVKIYAMPLRTAPPPPGSPGSYR